MARVKVRLDDVKAPEPIPPGAYLCEIAKGEAKVAKETDTEMVLWTLQIAEDGLFKGRKVSHNTTTMIDPRKDPDGTKTEFSLFMLKVFLEACGFQWDPDGFEPNDVVGSQVIAQIKVGEYQGRPNNSVERVMPVQPAGQEATG